MIDPKEYEFQEIAAGLWRNQAGDFYEEPCLSELKAESESDPPQAINEPLAFDRDTYNTIFHGGHSEFPY